MILDGARRAAAAALLLLAVAACGNGGTATPEPTAAPPVSASVEPSPAASLSEAPPPASTSAPSAGSTGGGATTTATPRPATSPEGVELVKQGGIAGINQTIEVEPDGTWRRASDGNPTSSGKLPADQMAQLQKLIADPKLMTESKRAGTGIGRCSDAFEYVLKVKSQLIHYTACGQANKPEVTLKIIQLLQNATK